MAKPTRIIGVDYGTARIGLAISDESKMLASSLKTLATEKKKEETARRFVEEVKRYAEEYGCEIEKIIIGLPLMMNGSVGAIAEQVQQFIALVQELTDIPIETRDERLTSLQAERTMRESGLSSKKQKKHVDALSAVLILQNYLDNQSMLS